MFRLAIFFSILSALGGASARAQAVAAVYDKDGNTNAIYYLNSSQHVQQLYMGSDKAWHLGYDFTVNLGAPAAAAGSAIAAVYDGDGNTNAVYYVNSSQHVQQLWMDTTWHVGWDATNALGAPGVAAGSAIAAVYDVDGNTNAVYYLNSSNHIQQLWMDTTWHLGWDATNTFGVPPAGGNAIAAVYDQDGNTNAVYYVNSSQHIQQLWMDTTWHVGWDATNALGAPGVAAGGTIAAVYDVDGNTNAVYYVNSTQHLQQLYMDTSWHVGWDATNILGAPPAAANSAIAAMYDQNGNTNAVYYVNTSQHIQQLYMDTSWHVGWDFTTGFGAPTAASGTAIAAAYDPIGNTNDVYYVDLSQHVQQLFMNSSWQVGYDFTVGLGAPAAQRTPGNPSKEYIRLNGQVIAIENF